MIHGGIDSFCILPFDLLGDADELVLRCVIFVDVIYAVFVASGDRSVGAVSVPDKEPSTRRWFGLTRFRWRKRRKRLQHRLVAFKQQPLGVLRVQAQRPFRDRRFGPQGDCSVTPCLGVEFPVPAWRRMERGAADLVVGVLRRQRGVDWDRCPRVERRVEAKRPFRNGGRRYSPGLTASRGYSNSARGRAAR